ncbi:hypothetical protein N8T08_000379 [Aspergillus melleus]|uniref:Uncharacterized protein n=1 Tax=Aspergillus melleus TaxID=138277 RepID=A0ACC3BC65_9EURO|nr:hypothetical protein N8T08_000379 [Aspergillus melleus]
MSLISYLHTRSQSNGDCANGVQPRPLNSSHKFNISEPNSLRSLSLFFTDKETSILLLYSGSIYASTYMVLSSMSDQLQIAYNLTTLQGSLCYFSTGFGTMSSALVIGRLLDWNFRRHAHLLGIEISKEQAARSHNLHYRVRTPPTLPLRR